MDVRGGVDVGALVGVDGGVVDLQAGKMRSVASSRC